MLGKNPCRHILQVELPGPGGTFALILQHFRAKLSSFARRRINAPSTQFSPNHVCAEYAVLNAPLNSRSVDLARNDLACGSERLRDTFTPNGRMIYMVTKRLLSILLTSTLLAGVAHGQPTRASMVSFDIGAGANPNATLVLGEDGNFYGSTADGGTYDVGTLFKMTSRGTFTVLVNFDGTNGANPFATLTPARNGSFYGTTFSGGSGGSGTLFRVTTTGELTTLVNFNLTNGSTPMAALTLGKDGSFYGTTEYGGQSAADGQFSGDGTVFRVTTNGTLTTLLSFAGTNGAHPVAGLTLGDDGSFYGTTFEGGGFNAGTVFRVTTNGELTSLLSFNNTNGGYPGAELTHGADGGFYGTTWIGGIYTHQMGNSFGTVFRMTTNGFLTTLLNFNYTNGAMPEAGLKLASDGCFYGTTYVGGQNDRGTVFRVTTNGTLTTLIEFDGTNGAGPITSLTLGTDGNFYGATEEGGTDYFIFGNAGQGTIFKVVVPPSIGVPSISNGLLMATASGLARPSVQIQATTNLWMPWSVLTNFVFTAGTAEFADPAAGISPMRFYRALVP